MQSSNIRTAPASAARRRRRLLKRLWQYVAWAGVILAGVSVAGAGYETYASARDLRLHPAPGRMVQVGGRDMHLYCTGPTGGPVVVLEAGDGRSSLTWSSVQPEVAQFARVCSYDRAGLGWSDPADGTHGGGDIIDDLHKLLANAGEPGPYVLVGHSFGGLYSRLYAARYPADVAGLVLVDAFHEDLAPDIASWQPTFALGKALAPVGFWRVMGAMGVMPQAEELDRLPAAVQGIARIQALRTSVMGVTYAEHAAAGAMAEELEGARPLGAKPVVVLTAGKRKADDWPADAVWTAVQQKLVGLSSAGKQVMAAESDHFIQLDQPDLVVNAIRSVLPR